MTDSILKQEIDIAIRQLEHKCIVYRAIAQQGLSSSDVAAAYEDALAHFERAITEDDRRTAPHYTRRKTPTTLKK